MFHVVFLVKRKDGMTQEEFTRYWIDQHTPLTARVPGLRSYHCFPMIGHDGDAPPFEAIAHISFDDEAAWETARDSRELAEAISDAPNFQEAELTAAFFAEEYRIV